ncbi:hypothetical protein K491DRAFT_691804 [Lophiostoma macrostomum CBS 122681]|uniref:Zn(2)-C6 fungal-type domain-containing protein n=1 Tax=Lophiostoma macrostomum CBS 122681 TaxID=1314788 RepID=A0A6A6TB80_9PLEO|nr:hypothetical protein K491DRAFT_691804 [Lophiostoma macrostomum CBS 122681]
MEPVSSRASPLRCTICGKHTKSDKAHKRHEYYCRSKLASSGVQCRRRSCTACIKAKKRCDVTTVSTPSCDRCQTQGISCEFQCGQESASSLETLHLSLPQFDFSDENLLSSGDDQQLFSSMMDDVNTAFGPDPLSLGVGDPIPLNAPWPAASNSLNLTSGSSLKLFDKLPVTSPAAMASRNIATSILRGIPDMMRRRATFPPFIHHRCYGSEADNWRLPTSLANAVSISHMFYRRDEQTRGLIWRTIDAEQQRLITECESRYMNEIELLATVQSVLIYVLMRIVDGPTDEPDLDARLLDTANRTLICLKHESGDFIKDEEFQGLPPPWSVWITIESFRRTVHVYRIANLLFNINIDVTCPDIPEFVVAPLPAGKTLWRANNAEDWAREWQKQVEETTFHGILRNGDLVKLKNGINERKQGNWDRWYASADELGILAVLSASLS